MAGADEISSVVETLITRLPKAELHIHVDGSIEPDLMIKIAERNGLIHLLPFKTVEEGYGTYQFGCIQDFLDLYFLGCKVLLTEQDFYDIMMAYLERAHADNIVHAEINFEPQSHTERGIPFETCFLGYYRATQDAKEKLGIDSSLIMSFLRNFGVEKAWETLKQATPYVDRMSGVGLAGTEDGNPNIEYKEVFAAAIEAGFLPTAHAGGECGPENIWDSIKELRVKRIQHGMTSIEDPELIAHLEDTQIALDVAPISNQKLKVFGGSPLVDEKLGELLSTKCSINFSSDDPGYFSAYMNTMLRSTAKTQELTPEKLYQLTVNGFTAAFITPEQRDTWLQQVKDVYEEVTEGPAP